MKIETSETPSWDLYFDKKDWYPRGHDNPEGRLRWRLVKLQIRYHIFFGNIVIINYLKKKRKQNRFI